MKTERGDWHRRTQRGTYPARTPGAIQRIKCSFCDKIFGSPESVHAHENSYHRKRLKKLREASFDPPPAEIPLSQLIIQHFEGKLNTFSQIRVLSRGAYTSMPEDRLNSQSIRELRQLVNLHGAERLITEIRRIARDEQMGARSTTIAKPTRRSETESL